MSARVSVVLITYNHAPYIAQAIEGVLAQRTDFDFELLIGEDESSDGTREIVREFAARHPERIRLFLRSRKDVIHVDGRATGRFNFMRTLEEARGEYVAVLEGDDCWTAPGKLQRQVDFLDTNRDCVACCHPLEYVRRGAEGKDEVAPRPPDAPEGTRFRLEDLMRGGVKIPLSSYMFRREVMGEFPAWFRELAMGDIPLFALHAEHGAIGCLAECMGIYTIHPGGIWSTGEAPGQTSIERMRVRNEQCVRLYETLDAHFSGRYHRLVAPNVATLLYQNAWSLAQAGDFAAARGCTLRAMRLAPWPREVAASLIGAAWLAAFAPWAYRAIRSAKR